MRKQIIKILILGAVVFLLWFFGGTLFLPDEAETEKKDDAVIEKKVIAEKEDLIRVFAPYQNEKITSPLVIDGEARGFWFFEASFPVVLTDWDGRIIAGHYAEAQLDPENPDSTWMTEEFVPFRAYLEFENPVFENASEDHFSRRGYLILQKDNPSGLPEHDDALEIPIRF